MNFCQGSLKFKWFHSKGAALVLMWALLTVAGNRMVYQVTMNALISGGKPHLISSTSVFVIVAAPFFGWLADAKLGNYKVVKIGITVSWLASVLLSLLCFMLQHLLGK